MDWTISLPRLGSLTAATLGDPSVTVAVIDGPVDLEHPGFAGSSLRAVEGDPRIACAMDNSMACQHGTVVAGVVSASRDSGAPGLAPGCPAIIRPIFAEGTGAGGVIPEVTVDDLVAALRDVLNAGARIVNLSLGLADSALEAHPALTAAFDEAQRRGVLLIAAGGNQGYVGPVPLFAHPWVLPVVGCDAHGSPLPDATLGPSVGRYGLMAPGLQVTSLKAGGGTRHMTGSSVAAPFVAGAAALLWSLVPGATARQVLDALRYAPARRGGIVPPLMDAEASLARLRQQGVV